MNLPLPDLPNILIKYIKFSSLIVLGWTFSYNADAHLTRFCLVHRLHIRELVDNRASFDTLLSQKKRCLIQVVNHNSPRTKSNFLHDWCLAAVWIFLFFVELFFFPLELSITYYRPLTFRNILQY